MTKISLLDEMITLDNLADWLVGVDVSDQSMSATGTTKKIKPSTLWSNIDIPAGQNLKYDGYPFLMAEFVHGNSFGGGAGNLTAFVLQEENTGFGLYALRDMQEVSAGANSAFGNEVLAELTIGKYNCAFGTHAGKKILDGDYNCIFGVDAVYTAISPNRNCVFGTLAMFNQLGGTENAIFGDQSLGGPAGIGQSPIHICAFGSFSQGGLSSGIDNNSFGWNSLNQIGAGSNTNAFGKYAGFGAVDVDYGIYLGQLAGFGNHTGDKNIQLGSSASAASFNQFGTGAKNVQIGHDGAIADPAGSNQLSLCNYIYGTGLSGTGATTSVAKIGFGIKAPAVECDVNGEIKTKARTVATLPAAAIAGEGARGFVTDATATTFLSIVTGGGANSVPVVCNGTNWLIG